MEKLISLLMCFCILNAVVHNVAAMQYTVPWTVGTDLQQWGNQHTFYVDDELYFQYQPGQSSVLVVTEPDFNDCNINSPVASDSGSGDMVLTLDTAQTYYFIAGDPAQCTNGLRLSLDVVPLATIPPPADTTNNNNYASPATTSTANPGHNPVPISSSPVIFLPPPTNQYYRNAARQGYSASSIVMVMSLAISVLLAYHLS